MTVGFSTLYEVLEINSHSWRLADLICVCLDKVRLQYEVEIAKLALQSTIGQFPIPLEK